MKFINPLSIIINSDTKIIISDTRISITDTPIVNPYAPILNSDKKIYNYFAIIIIQLIQIDNQIALIVNQISFLLLKHAISPINLFKTVNFHRESLFSAMIIRNMLKITANVPAAADGRVAVRKTIRHDKR